MGYLGYEEPDRIDLKNKIDRLTAEVERLTEALHSSEASERDWHNVADLRSAEIIRLTKLEETDYARFSVMLGKGKASQDRLTISGLPAIAMPSSIWKFSTDGTLRSIERWPW